MSAATFRSLMWVALVIGGVVFATGMSAAVGADSRDVAMVDFLIGFIGLAAAGIGGIGLGLVRPGE